MNAPLTVLAAPGNLAAAMRAIGRDARSAANALALAPAAQKNAALAGMAKAIRRARLAILDANAEDLGEASDLRSWLECIVLSGHALSRLGDALELRTSLEDGTITRLRPLQPRTSPGYCSSVVSWTPPSRSSGVPNSSRGLQGACLTHGCA